VSSLVLRWMAGYRIEINCSAFCFCRAFARPYFYCRAASSRVLILFSIALRWQMLGHYNLKPETI
jgi:hypothetical protein